jgi:hypothetical protein
MAGIEAMVAIVVAGLYCRLACYALAKIGGGERQGCTNIHQVLSRFRLSAGMIG